jgi:hypothetical protein
MSERDDASYIQHLESKVAELEAQIKQLEEEIKRLKKEKGLSSAREGLTFNPHTGLWSDPAGQLYCPTCLGDEKRNPLKVESHGWRCTAGNHYFPNPDAPLPTVRMRRPGRI